MILGVFLMYISSNEDQLTIEDFFMPFGGKLLKTNRWVKLASMMPWEHIEQIYMESFQSERGRPATSSRIAFGAIFIKENDSLTDESTVAAIAENPYMQYFLGLTAFQAEPLFDSSMMVHFRKRFPVEEVAKINEYICTGVWQSSSGMLTVMMRRTRIPKTIIPIRLTQVYRRSLPKVAKRTRIPPKRS